MRPFSMRRVAADNSSLIGRWWPLDHWAFPVRYCAVTLSLIRINSPNRDWLGLFSVEIDIHDGLLAVDTILLVYINCIIHLPQTQKASNTLSCCIVNISGVYQLISKCMLSGIHPELPGWFHRELLLPAPRLESIIEFPGSDRSIRIIDKTGFLLQKDTDASFTSEFVPPVLLSKCLIFFRCSRGLNHFSSPFDCDICMISAGGIRIRRIIWFPDNNLLHLRHINPKINRTEIAVVPVWSIRPAAYSEKPASLSGSSAHRPLHACSWRSGYNSAPGYSC